MGPPARRARHGQFFRIRVTSRDGKPAAVNLQIDDHPGEARPYVLRQIRDCLRLRNTEQVVEVLTTWTREQLVEHLQRFTHEELKPPAIRRR